MQHTSGVISNVFGVYHSQWNHEEMRCLFFFLHSEIAEEKVALVISYWKKICLYSKDHVGIPYFKEQV